MDHSKQNIAVLFVIAICFIAVDCGRVNTSGNISERVERTANSPLDASSNKEGRLPIEVSQDTDGTATISAKCDKNGVIGNFIANRAEKEKANEYSDIRKVLCTDINDDGEDDALVLYTLEGFEDGNGWTRNLAAFVSRNGELEFSDEKRVGWKNYATITDVTFRPPNEVELTINTYAPTDGSCCPSIPGVENYTIDQKTYRLNTTKQSP